MEPTTIVYISAEVVVGFMSVVGNSLVLAVIIKTRQLHTVTNVFVGNLAVADIVVGVLVAPSAALSFLGLPHNFYACVFINCLILMFTNVSILMLMSVAIERFIAIKEPFVYQRLLTVQRAIYLNLCVWVLGVILGLLPMYGWHRGYRVLSYCSFTDIINYEYLVYFQFFGLVLLPLAIMLCIYIYILLIVRKHMRQTNALHSHLQQNKNSKDGFNKDVKAAKMFALVILLFGIFWFPVNLFNCISLFCGRNCPFPIQGLLFAIVLSHANSSINPFLYAASNSRIKRGLKEIFGFKLTPEDRSTTDYDNKRHTVNGTSYIKDNSVGPMSSVIDLPNNLEDSVQTITLTQKSSLAKSKMSVLPSDNHELNGNGTLPNTALDTISDKVNQQNINVSKQHINGSNTVVSWSSPISNIEGLPKNQDLVSLSSLHQNQHELETSLKNLQEKSRSPAISPTTSSPVNHQQGNENHGANQNGRQTPASVNSNSINSLQEKRLRKNINNKDENEEKQINYANDKVDRMSPGGKSDTIDCWKTPSSDDAHIVNTHETGVDNIAYTQDLNGKRQSFSMNVLQNNQTSRGEICEELNVTKLNGYVSSESALSSLSHHGNSSNENGICTESINDRDTGTNNITSNIAEAAENKATSRSSIHFHETFGDSET